MRVRAAVSAMLFACAIGGLCQNPQINPARTGSAEVPERFILKMDQPTPMAEVPSSDFPTEGRIQILHP